MTPLAGRGRLCRLDNSTSILARSFGAADSGRPAGASAGPSSGFEVFIAIHPTTSATTTIAAAANIHPVIERGARSHANSGRSNSDRAPVAAFEVDEPAA